MRQQSSHLELAVPKGLEAGGKIMLENTIDRPKLRAPSKLRGPLKCHGGKYYLVHELRPLFQQAVTSMAAACASVSVEPRLRFIDACGGGGSVTLNVDGFDQQVYNDLDPERANLFSVIKNRCSELVVRLRRLKYCSEVFEAATHRTNVGTLILEPSSLDPIEAAVDCCVANRMSRGGLGKSFAWSERLRGGQPGDLNAWETMLDLLPVIAKRLQRVEIFCVDVLDLLAGNVGFNVDANTLVYLDPPYHHSTRSVKKAYRYEFTGQAHETLLKLALRSPARIAISGYRCELYDRLLGHWRSIEFNMPNHSGQNETKQRRTEVLWTNWNGATENSFQQAAA